jgi:hypothetical protein
MPFPQPNIGPFLTFLEQCDLSRPACSRCRRQGLRCVYLVPQQGQVFINRSVANPFVRAVDIVSNTDRTKPSKNSEVTPSLTRHHESLKYSVPKSPDPESMHRMQLLSKFIEIYHPKVAQGPTRTGQTPASWVHVLPDITLTNSAYNKSLAALCLEQLGIWNHDLVLGNEGSQLYGSALGELRKTIGAIGGRKLGTPEATLASIVILTTYEVSIVAARIRTESNLSYCSSSRVRRGRILGGCMLRVVLTLYSFLDQASANLLWAVSSSRKYESSA